MRSELSVLLQAEPFRGIPLEDLAALCEQGRPRSFPAGSRMASQGCASRSVYIVLKGRLRVERSHPDLTAPFVLAELGPGEVAAGLGVLNGWPCSASVMAVEDTEALEIDGEALARMAVQRWDTSAVLVRALSRSLHPPHADAGQTPTGGNGA